MNDLYLFIIPLTVIEITMISCLWLFRSSTSFEEKIKPEIIISPNYTNFLFFPLLIYTIFSAIIFVFIKDNVALLLIIILEFVVILSGTLLVFINKYKRYFLTDKGIVILSLVTRRYTAYTRVNKRFWV